MFDHISDNPHLIVNGFIETGITESIRKAVVACEKYDFSSCNDSEELSEATFSD